MYITYQSNVSRLKRTQIVGQVHRPARAASSGESSLDVPLPHWVCPRLPLLGTKSATDGNPLNIWFEAIYSLRFGEVHERSYNHRTGNNGLPNLEHWLSWGHHLSKYQGENVFLKSPIFTVGNEQVQVGTDKSKSPLGKIVEGCKCHPGTGS